MKRVMTQEEIDATDPLIHDITLPSSGEDVRQMLLRDGASEEEADFAARHFRKKDEERCRRRKLAEVQAAERVS